MIKKFKQFANDTEIKEVIGGGEYDLIGCFREPDKYSIIAGTEFLEYESDNKTYYDSDLDFEILISDKDTVESLYQQIINYLKDEEIYQSVVVGIFYNGDNSCLLVTDDDYSFEGMLMQNVISTKDYEYLRIAHAMRERIKLESPTIYKKIETFFHNRW